MANDMIAEYESALARFGIADFDLRSCEEVLGAFNLIDEKCCTTDGKPDRNKAEIVYRVKRDEYDRCKAKKDEFEKDMVKFSIVVPFDEERNVWLAKRINIEKTFFGYTTVPGGKVDEGESHEDAAIRESREEAGLSIVKKGLKFVGEHKFFLESKLHVGKVYTASVHHQIPVRNEPNNLGDWFSVPYTEIDDYNLTPALNELATSIKLVIKSTRICKYKGSDRSECDDGEVLNNNGKRIRDAVGSDSKRHKLQ